MLTLISNDSTLLNTVISNEYGYCTHILNDKMKILWEITQERLEAQPTEPVALA